MSASRVAAGAALLPLAVVLATSSCEMIAGIRNHTPLPLGDGGAGGTGGTSATGGSGTGGAGMGGHVGAGGTGSGGVSGTGGSGVGGTGAGGRIGTGGMMGTGGTGCGGMSVVGGTGGAIDAGATTDGPPCVTSFPGQLLDSYDMGTTVVGWISANILAGSNLQVGFNARAGHTCPGADQLGATFSGYGATLSWYDSVLQPIDWTGRSKLHLWMQIPALNGPSGYSLLSELDVVVQSASNANGSTQVFPIQPFSDGAWHEIVFNLLAATPTPVDLSTAGKIQIVLTSVGEPPVCGPTAPGQIILIVDDIWLE